jgi:hypothetical protein
MNYKDINGTLKSNFEMILKPMGFKAKSGLQGCRFTIHNREFVNSLSYGIVNYIDEFKTSCTIGVGNKRFHLIQSTAIDEDVSYSTVSCRYADYLGVVNYSFEIRNEADITEWMKLAAKFINEFALQFFEKYNSINELDLLFNEEPSKNIIYCYDLSIRIINSLIAAKLNNNSKYNDLRDYYRSEVESKFQGYFMYEKCMKVIDFLDKYTSEELNKLTDGL